MRHGAGAKPNMNKNILLLFTVAALAQASAQSFVQLTAQLNGANEIPTNDSPLMATASLTLGSPYDEPGVSNVLNGSVVIPWQWSLDGASDPFSSSFIFDIPFLWLHLGPVTFQDEAGNTITNLATPGSTQGAGIFPAPLIIFFGSEGEIIRAVVLTPEQVSDLLAGRWFIHVGATTSSGEDYPQGSIRGRIIPVDSDADGVPDYLDQCPGTPAGVVVDSHGCSIEQLCPCRKEWKNHGEYVGCVNKAATGFQREGFITGATQRGIMQAAAGSDCGKQLTPAAPFSGISGQSVITPFFLWGIACDEFGCPQSVFPFPTSIKVFSDSGRLVTELQTDAQGQFQVHLKEGAYRLVPWVPNPPPPNPFWYFNISEYAAPFNVTVPFKRFTNVVINYQYLFFR